MTAESIFARNAPMLLMAGSALAWYVASLVLSERLSGRGGSESRGRALGHWVPIVLFAIVAALSRQPEIAVAMLFATSVAALSLVLGMVLATSESLTMHGHRAGGFPVIQSASDAARAAHLSDSVAAHESVSIDARRGWAFVLPVALLALLAGFSGQLRPLHAAVLLVEGLVILLLWRSDHGSTDDPQHRRDWRGALELCLGIALACLAAWGGVRATRDIADKLGLASALPIASWLGAPAMVLPMIGSGMLLARRASFDAVVSTSVNLVILNLCVAIPLIVVVWSVAPSIPPSTTTAMTPVQESVASTAPATAPATAPSAAQSPPALVFPISVWRVDTVMLILLGLFLLPVAFGRWTMGRSDGAILVAVYLGYMWLTAWIARS